MVPGLFERGYKSMPIEELPILTYYDIQRFKQYSPQDCANWYLVDAPTGKKGRASYPAMGRKHVRFFNRNRLLFNSEPRSIFKSINFLYVVVGSLIFQIDSTYDTKTLNNPDFSTVEGEIFSAILPVGTDIFIMLTDGEKIFLISEKNSTMQTITDPNAPGGSTTGGKPAFIAAFGDRFVVSAKDSPEYYLSRANVNGTPSNIFTDPSLGGALTNRASGRVRQFGVLHNQLYIFTDFTTDIWMNIPTQFGNTVFPWKLNTSFSFDHGIASATSLDIGFGRMVWLSKNRGGLVTLMMSTGGRPQPIASQAINVLIQRALDDDSGLSPFLANSVNGFLYQYEDTIFYRVSANFFPDLGTIDLDGSDSSLEYNFSTNTWHRNIELDGQRNLIQKHVFFNNKHLVTAKDQPVIYEMLGSVYINEIRNELQPDPQAQDAFKAEPMRYEAITKNIFLSDYSEFMTEYVQIDFVWGEQTFNRSTTPFNNTTFLVTEESTEEDPVYVTDENGAFIILDGTNTPELNETFYNNLFKPHIELFFSDDGGRSFSTADNLEFSQLGVYEWRMRWYQLGVSRNRVYKLKCVSPAPLVILGGIMNIKRISGGAN